MPEGRDRQATPTARFFGALMMAAGVLMILTGGLCSSASLLLTLFDVHPTDWAELLTGDLLYLGLTPFVTGVALVVLGRALRRGA